MGDMEGQPVDLLPSGTDPRTLYGALEAYKIQERYKKHLDMRRRRRVNCVAALLSLFVPWLLFLFLFAAVSFWFHYYAPMLTVLLCLACFAFAVFTAYEAYLAWKQHDHDRIFHKLYLAVGIAMAVIAASVLGDYNFWVNMQPVYEVSHLATYSQVEPSSMQLPSGRVEPTSGKRYQDAGKVYFDSKAVIDSTRAMSLKMGDLYCVAPIVNPDCGSNCGYDFWAVGKNCCSEDVADFRCGEYNNPNARAGLRMMYDHDRTFYRLAVLQAEGSHQIISTHPLFFEWMHDPLLALTKLRKKGYRLFIVAMIASFIGNAAILAVALKWARQAFWSTTS